MILIKGISALSSKTLKSCCLKFPSAEAKHKQKITGTEYVTCQNYLVLKLEENAQIKKIEKRELNTISDLL